MEIDTNEVDFKGKQHLVSISSFQANKTSVKFKISSKANTEIKIEIIFQLGFCLFFFLNKIFMYLAFCSLRFLGFGQFSCWMAETMKWQNFFCHLKILIGNQPLLLFYLCAKTLWQNICTHRWQVQVYLYTQPIISMQVTHKKLIFLLNNKLLEWQI